MTEQKEEKQTRLAVRTASGSNLILKRVEEDEFGNLPDDPETFQHRFSTYTPDFTKNEVVDPTVNSNRQDTEVRFSTRDLSFSMEAVLSHSDQDRLIASGLWSEWTPTDDQGERTITIGSPAVQKSFTFEADQTDIDTQRRFTGLTVNSFTINSPLDANTTISYDMLGREEELVETSLGDATAYENTQSYLHIDGTISLGDLTEDCVVQSFDMTVTNNADANFCWGERTAHAVTEANVEVTGNLTLFYVDSEINDMYLNDTEISLNVILRNEEGHEFELDMPRVMAANASNPFVVGQRVVTLAYRALAARDGSHNALTIRARGYPVIPIPPTEGE
ncbi:phage tail tube protein [Vibrio astriarenae]|uniref:phage tail tube protein n=1 Tax=Vibrio astriarenae TaxID=1481923 RepID=UPI003734D1A7